MTLNWKKIREFYSDRALLVLIVLIYFLSCFCSPVVSQFTCTGDVDCTGNQCCSTYGYCGTGPDYCRTGKKTEFSLRVCADSKKLKAPEKIALKKVTHYNSNFWNYNLHFPSNITPI